MYVVFVENQLERHGEAAAHEPGHRIAPGLLAGQLAAHAEGVRGDWPLDTVQVALRGASTEAGRSDGTHSRGSCAVVYRAGHVLAEPKVRYHSAQF